MRITLRKQPASWACAAYGSYWYWRMSLLRYFQRLPTTQQTVVGEQATKEGNAAIEKEIFLAYIEKNGKAWYKANLPTPRVP